MTWRDTGLTALLGVRLPIVQAPMAGGWSTPAMVAAVSAGGGLGSIAAARLTPDQLRLQVAEVRALTDKPFAVNLFAPLPAPSSDRLEQWAALLGVPLPPRHPPPSFDEQLACVLSERVPVLSFTFGIPPLDGVDVVTIGTATTVAEAVALERAGADLVVAQGYEAGGHRGTFLAADELSLIGTLALVPQIVDAVGIPVIAAGGIMDGRGIAAALVLGAAGAQLGTAFLRCLEAGTSVSQRQQLAGATTLTRVLSGRTARAVRTELIDRLEASGVQPPDYPLPSGFLATPALLAGQGSPLARSLPTAVLVAALEAETDAILGAPSGPAGAG